MKKKLFICMILLFIAIPWFIFENNHLEVNEIFIEHYKIPSNFVGFRIAQISDLHNTNNKDLINQLKEGKPDIIVITGDLIDSRNTKIDISVSFVNQAIEIAPIYYVTGNHESRVKEYPILEESLNEMGVHILKAQQEWIEKGNEKIIIAGINDSTFYQNQDEFKSDLKELSNHEYFTILLSHKPEFFDDYVKNDFDLVLSGHAHGGQIRLPLIGGLIAPGQGLFPKYDAGLYTENQTHMVVSRGIGNSLFPIRINNHPEIVFVELS